MALVLVVSLLGASDVRGGFGLAPAGKTTGPALTAAIVIDVTEGGADEGLSSIRVQKAGSSAAVFFDSAYVVLIVWTECTANGLDLQASTNAKFVGKMDGWVPDPARTSLLAQFGEPNKAAITDTDYAACTSVGARKILSFTAVIQFEQ
ncbi:MAG: hypothetical protein HY729_07025 [Candidatus Rokubacteria bacterium]|nr:hypothetical protein [Candidatus Rokubacteria bacterium]